MHEHRIAAAKAAASRRAEREGADAARAPITLTVPASLVPDLAEEAVTLLGVKAEALHLTIVAYLEDHAARDAEGIEALLAELHRLRAELREIDQLAEQLGWGLQPVREALELSAPAGLVHELLSGAVIDLADRVGAACRRYERGSATLASLEEAARRQVELIELLARVAAPAQHGS